MINLRLCGRRNRPRRHLGPAPLDDLVPVHGNEFVKHNHLALCAEDTPELNTCVFEKAQAQESILGSIAPVLNGTARIGSAAHTECVSKEENAGSLSNVQSGDVLVSHPTAVREHEISIVPNAPHAISPTHDAAVSDGRSEADAKGVDAWLTEDQTHVVKIASHRTPDK